MEGEEDQNQIIDQVQVLSVNELVQEVNEVFHQLIYPILIVCTLISISLESQIPIYFSEFFGRICVISSFASIVLTLCLYIVTILISQPEFADMYRKFRCINIISGILILGLAGAQLYNVMVAGSESPVRDLKWFRSFFTFLALAVKSHFVIVKLYEDTDPLHSVIFNRSFVTLLPYTYEEINSSFHSGVRSLLPIEALTPLFQIIFLLIECIYNMKMSYWATQELHQEFHILILFSQLNIMQMFSIFITAISIFNGSQTTYYSYQHTENLKSILLFIYHLAFLATYKIYLTIQLLSSSSHLNFYRVSIPLLLVTLVPLLAATIKKRMALKLFRIRNHSQLRAQVFAEYKSTVILNQGHGNHNQDLHLYFSQQLNSFIAEIVLNEVCLTLAILLFGLMNINQLLPIHFQTGIGLRIQEFYDLLSTLFLYISALLIAYEVFHNHLENSEFGVFSSILLHQYNAKVIQFFVGTLISIILSAYLINITEDDTTLHIGPLIAILIVSLILIFLKFSSKQSINKFVLKIKQIKSRQYELLGINVVNT